MRYRSACRSLVLVCELITHTFSSLQVITTTAVCYTRISDTVLVSEVEPVLLGITLLYLVAKSSDHPRDLRDCISVATALADPVAVAPIAVDDR